MANKKNQPKKSFTPLIDPSLPFEHRKRMLFHLSMEGGPEGDEILKGLFNAAASANGKELESQKLKELTELIDEIQKGALRAATFDRLSDQNGSVCRARVLLEDGGVAYCVVPDAELAARLQCGDTVLLAGQGQALLGVDPAASTTAGEVARLERRIDHERIEVSLRDFERHVYRASAALVEKLNNGQATPGCQVLVHPRRLLAMDTVPAPDGLSHYWYLDRQGVPDVIVERDIGSPPQYIEELAEHVRMWMTDPGLPSRYRLRRPQTKLLFGITGSGKTLSIAASHRRIYEVMSEVTGVPIGELPPRVLRLRMPKVLNKWLGESDKRLDRFFDEVDQLADEQFDAPNGKHYELPVIAICEEVDGLARARGEGDPIYDRIQTTALERLDTNYRGMKNRLVLFLFTSNVPHLIDAAFLRRAGGTAEHFGRLDRRSFAAVLAKHLRGLPFPADYGQQQEAERQVLRQVADWMFSPNGHDPGQVQLTYVGSTTPDIKHRRDFLTGSLVDRAVQQAAMEACRAERLGCERPGLTPKMIMAACDAQIRTMVDQLTPHNVGNYVTLPEGVRVGDVRRIQQPRVAPWDLETDS